jgi:anti-sigma factor RsiW
MSCRDIEIQLQARLDGELDDANNQRVETHLADCASCRAYFESLQTLSAALKNPALRYAAPLKLRHEISGAKTWRPRNWTRPAVAFAMGALLVWIVPQVRAPRGETALQDEVIAGHVRSLMANHLSDVISTDQHTVKPWFAGRLDFSPPVLDLSAHGFVLVGGRLDYLDKRTVSAIVYRRDQHRINVFIWPAKEPESSAPQWKFVQGYHIANWRSHAMNYWVISDLNAKELGVLVGLLEN